MVKRKYTLRFYISGKTKKKNSSPYQVLKLGKQDLRQTTHDKKSQRTVKRTYTPWFEILQSHF